MCAMHPETPAAVRHTNLFLRFLAVAPDWGKTDACILKARSERTGRLARLRHDKKKYSVQKLSFVYHNGHFPKSRFLTTACGEPACINGAHLQEKPRIRDTPPDRMDLEDLKMMGKRLKLEEREACVIAGTKSPTFRLAGRSMSRRKAVYFAERGVLLTQRIRMTCGNQDCLFVGHMEFGKEKKSDPPVEEKKT